MELKETRGQPKRPMNRYFYQTGTQPLQNATCYGP